MDETQIRHSPEKEQVLKKLYWLIVIDLESPKEKASGTEKIVQEPIESFYIVVFQSLKNADFG
ncbi:hypothetical protein KIN20_026525 [Parelaphostrongylus tenuis]|uniref:Uncharacterized protein n=1 Tax=Parelaphostrongylus tenuis TaxID=148309 RepID=A0AAD5QY39_PARTN|nr:hypothetical protein KIN20_026525 [Parelaphostrongylus tenuis]